MKVDKLIEGFNEKLGAGTVHTASELIPLRKMMFQIPIANYVSQGGLHIGRINEFVGGNGTLKSYLLYDMIAKFQRYDWANNEPNAFVGFRVEKKTTKVKGETRTEIKRIIGIPRKGYAPRKEPKVKRAMLTDMEGTYTKEWGAGFGIHNDTLIRIQADSPQSAIDIGAAMMQEDEICLNAYDSASIVEMDDEWDKSMDSATMGSNTRFWSRAVRKITRAINANPNMHKDCTFILINSLYSKVGMVMGNPETIRNGEQLKLAKSLSLYMRSGKEIKASGDDGEVLGKNVYIKCIKNKVGTQGREGNFFYAFVDTDDADQYCTNERQQYVDMGVKSQIIQRSGAIYKFGGKTIKGMENLIVELEKDRSLYKNLQDTCAKELFHG